MGREEDCALWQRKGRGGRGGVHCGDSERGGMERKTVGRVYVNLRSLILDKLSLLDTNWFSVIGKTKTCTIKGTTPFVVEFEGNFATIQTTSL